jgi:hypothetical protein
VHMATWCMYAHIEFGSFISHLTITHMFWFQHSGAHVHLSASYFPAQVCGRVETKKDRVIVE